MAIRRTGMALPLVVVFGAFMALIVFAVMRFSSSEMHFTAQNALQKQAAMLAFSGINIAEMALAKGRWYQPPYKQPVDGNRDGTISREEAAASSLIDRPNFAELDFEPDGAGRDGCGSSFRKSPSATSRCRAICSTRVSSCRRPTCSITSRSTRLASSAASG
jgi:hypothetical protein